MTIITWCKDKIRNAYRTCKRVIFFWKRDEFEFPEANNYNVQQLHISEQDPSPWSPSADENSSPQQQRRRPDIPTVKRLSVDPEMVLAVYRACKELQVPMGDEDNDDESKVQQ